MFKISIYSKLLFSLTLFSYFTASAQRKESYLFLGDTVKISKEHYSKINPDQQKYLKDLGENKYLICDLGDLKIKDKSYRLLDPLNDGVTKVLVIGNSFSDDGVESYLHDMARSVGKPLVIGNLFRGGAPLDFHLKNALGNIKIYSYRKTAIDGIKSNTDKTSILEALKDENWDYICFQQASATSGDWTTVEASLPALFKYVQENYPVSSVKYLYHQTWAYAQNSITKNFENYDRDQQLMYNKIVDVSKKVQNLIPVYKLIPSGTAIQNARTSYIGDNFTREGYHLDLAYGRFTAASTWFETIFGDLDQMNFKPSYLNGNDILIAKEAAIKAVENPYQVSKLHQYEQQRAKYVPFEAVRVNFGSDLLIGGWNSLLFEKAGSGRYGLMDNKNNPTSVNVIVMENFDGRKADGLNKTSFGSGIPSQITKSYFHANLNKENAQNSFLQISNLDKKRKYNIIIISTLQEHIGDLGIDVSGNSSLVKTINPSYNRIDEMLFDNVQPSKEGKINIKFVLHNDSVEGRAIINGLIIEEVR